jgi:hypothetical protein
MSLSTKLSTRRGVRGVTASAEPPHYGWMGAGGGRSRFVRAPLEFRGSTTQACGLWPFATGAATPLVGVPLGRSLINDATVCCDPLSWFQEANLIHNPSCFILGKPGLGKSSVIRRMPLGLAGYGVLSMFLGDTKGEHVDLVRAMGGRVFRLGPNRDSINVLDISQALEAERRLRSAGFREQANEVRADAERRRLILVETLISIARKGVPVTDRETAIIGEALTLLERDSDAPPVLPDLVRLIESRPEELRRVALDRGDEVRYQDITENLVVSLRGLTGQGQVGEIFSRQSTVKLDLDRSCVFDISAVRGDDSLLAAALVVCWSIGFSAVTIGQVLYECGLEPLRHWFIPLDELWRPIRAGRGMVDRVDELTRLNRQWGVAQVPCTHTMSDLVSLPNAADAEKARGFVERAGMIICGGLPKREMKLLAEVVDMSAEEVRTLTGWQDPPNWDQDGADAPPPGRGNFLIKVGGRPGIPIHVALTAAELSLNDTNKLWHQRSRLQLDDTKEGVV